MCATWKTKFAIITPRLKRNVYCSYLDDILLVLDSFQELIAVSKDIFQDNSILNLTFELETTKKISFLH